MTHEQQQRVFIVDSSAARLQKILALLQSVRLVAETYGTPGEFLENRDVSHSGCLILGLRLPQMSGLELFRRLWRQGDLIPVIFFTEHGDVATAVTAMREGAFDFLEASTGEQHLLDRVNAALRRDREIRAKTAERMAAAARIGQLSPRERAVLDLLMAGKGSKDIARELEATPKTVDVHRANILKKVDVESVAQLACLYFIAGLARTRCRKEAPEPESPPAGCSDNARGILQGAARR
jgi:two-component system response regulator FixJ